MKVLLNVIFVITFSVNYNAFANCSEVPNYECDGSESYCEELLPFLPEKGEGYWNYPINGETPENQYRSFARRALILLIQHAAAWTKCISTSFQTGNKHPLGLGDMSEADGAIPGTSIEQPGHPNGTHLNGRDIDIAYYQKNTPDNRLRPICAHRINGKEQYHCVSTPHLLDAKRTAAFIGKLHDSPRLRVIGVDGKVGPIVLNEMDRLCDQNILTGRACEQNRRRVAYEVENTGHGWYAFHHHHLHVSLMTSREWELNSWHRMPNWPLKMLDPRATQR